MKVGVYILLLFFLFFSCKQVETGHVTVIHLQPNEKSILKVSDYFNRVEAVLLRDTFFFGVKILSKVRINISFWLRIILG